MMGQKMGFVMEAGCRSTWRQMIQHRIIIGEQNDRFTEGTWVMASLSSCGVSVDDP